MPGYLVPDLPRTCSLIPRPIATSYPQALPPLAPSLRHLELRSLDGVTPAGLAAAHRLPRLTMLAVAECSGVDKEACRWERGTRKTAGNRVSVREWGPGAGVTAEQLRISGVVRAQEGPAPAGVDPASE